MKDRLLSVLSPWLALPLAVVLMAGTFWLAAHRIERPSKSQARSADVAPVADVSAGPYRAAVNRSPRLSPSEPPAATGLRDETASTGPSEPSGTLAAALPGDERDAPPLAHSGATLPPNTPADASGGLQLFPPVHLPPVDLPPVPVEIPERWRSDSQGGSWPRVARSDRIHADVSASSAGGADAHESKAPGPAESGHDEPVGNPDESGHDEWLVQASTPEGPEAAVASPGLLPVAPDRPLARSRQLELIAREADAHTRRGFELAGRKAYFSARAEFLHALRLVSQGLDAEYQTSTHSRSLAAGWTAIKEAGDFVPTGSQLEADLDLAGIIAGHETPVLKDASLTGLTPLAALRCYLTFAQEQLAASAGEELAGSMALHGLGNLYRELADKRGQAVRAVMPKAVVFYQAALLVDPCNYMALNELGVLLARGGRPEDACSLLEQSVNVRPHAAGLYNLAAVYRRLGQTELAERAYQQYRAVDRAEGGKSGARLNAAGHDIEWVEPAVFASLPVGAQGDATAAARPDAKLSAAWPTGADPHVDSRPLGVFRAVALAGSDQREPGNIVLCQALGPAAPCNICAVDGACCDWSRRGGWERARALCWQAYAQGEYVGHERTAHVPEYRLRVDDLLDMVYRVTRDETPTPYRLNVGDEVRVESFTDPELTRDLIIQPDGTITLRLLGQVHATGRTVTQLRDAIEELYTKYYPIPAITVTPLKVNTKLEDLRAVVDSRYGPGGQTRPAKITPEGTIALPVVGSVQAQGLTLPELQQELNEAYREKIEGMEIIPVLVQRAPRFVYVLGEVRVPGRFELTGPTTVLQALSMAGSWNVGARLRQIVVFRRGDDWRLMATIVDLEAALNGEKACPPGEIWLSDSDVIIVPKSRILRADDFISLVFARGVYGMFPVQAAVNFSRLSTI